MKASAVLAMAASALAGGIPLDSGVFDAQKQNTYARGYKLGEGYNLSREQTRRVRQMRRDAANACPRCGGRVGHVAGCPATPKRSTDR